MQTQSPRTAQPQSLAKCRVLAVGEELHFFGTFLHWFWQAGVISWTLNYAVVLLGPVWTFVYHFDIKCVLRPLDLDLWPPVCRGMSRVLLKISFKSLCVHRRSTSSLTGILYTQIRANARPTVLERTPVLELSIQHIAHKTGQLLSAKFVCERLLTLAPTGPIYEKKVALIVCEVNTCMPGCFH